MDVRVLSSRIASAGVQTGNARAREFYRRHGLVEDGAVDGDCDLRMHLGRAVTHR